MSPARPLVRRIVAATTLTFFLAFACSWNWHATGAANSVIPSFESVRTFGVGDFPTDWAVDDFNRDGRPDLVIACPDGAGVPLLFGDGTGNFSAPTFLQNVTGGWTIASGDFNRDGNPDVVSTKIGASYITVSLGMGNGEFIFPPLSYFSTYQGGDTHDLEVHDFNHDGNADLASAHPGSVSVILGNGSGGFLDPVDYITDFGAYELVAADLNNDGNIDLVSTNAHENPNVSVLLGDGTGGFEASSLPFLPGGSPGPMYPHGPIALDDFNRDSKIDLVLVDADDASVSLRFGDGTGGFGTATNFPTNRNGHCKMQAADFNGDGKLDLAVTGFSPNNTSFSPNNVSILLGDGAGGLDSPLSYPGGEFPIRITVADLNLDGKPDILTGNIHALTTSVLINNTYQTAVGQNSSVVIGQTTLTFDNVTTGGTTTVTPIDPASIGEVPGGFAVSNSIAYEISTTAAFTGSVTLAFKVPGPISEEDFNALAILHNEDGTLVDVTASTPARDYANLTIYATTTSFSPFYLARRRSHIRPLFDQTKAHKSGSTIPIKLQVLDGNDANVSSSGTSLVVRDLKLISGNTTALVIDSGNASPDYTFRYDPSLGGAGGGYIFNLSSRGLASGQYVISFYVGSERSFFYTVKFEVK